jgi:hypothetical protein
MYPMDLSWLTAARDVVIPLLRLGRRWVHGSAEHAEGVDLACAIWSDQTEDSAGATSMLRWSTAVRSPEASQSVVLMIDSGMVDITSESRR